MEGRLGALLDFSVFGSEICHMWKATQVLLVLLMAGCSGCGERNSEPPQVRIDQIEIINYDPNYVQDPWAEDGGPDFYLKVFVDNDLYWDSEQDVVMDASLSQRIPTPDLNFAGGELDQNVSIVLWDADGQDATISGDDYIGEVSFVPRDLMASEPVRHSLFGGYLEIDLLLTW